MSRSGAAADPSAPGTAWAWRGVDTRKRPQLEGGIVHAASMTLKEQVTLDGDGITSLDWDRYPILNSSKRLKSKPLLCIISISRP
jgi:hypothetical protein